jgi:hypothetical protein
MKDELDSLLQKEMDRKGFIKHVAIGFAAITGIAAMLKTLNGFGNANRSGMGYGTSTYGGAKPQQPNQTSKS